MTDKLRRRLPAPVDFAYQASKYTFTPWLPARQWPIQARFWLECGGNSRTRRRPLPCGKFLSSPPNRKKSSNRHIPKRKNFAEIDRLFRINCYNRNRKKKARPYPAGFRVFGGKPLLHSTDVIPSEARAACVVEGPAVNSSIRPQRRYEPPNPRINRNLQNNGGAPFKPSVGLSGVVSPEL